MKKFPFVAAVFVAVVSASAGPVTESPRELPLEKEVDVLVLGGGSAALSAAVAAAKEGASVFLAAPRPYVGDDVAGTLRIFEGRKLVPISHKRACDEAFKVAGVAYMTGLFPSEVLVGDDGAVAGAVLVSKSGRAAVRAGHVLDCTDHAAFARVAGIPFQPFAGGRLAFERTVVAKDEPKADGMTVVERRERPLKSGKVYVCRFEHEMKDLSYASFAEAEQRARDLTWTPSGLDAADRLRFVPPVCATGTLDHLTLVGAWAEKDPAKREAEKISTDCWIGLTRTVALAAEGLANPKLASALEAALRRPGVMGHAVKSIDELAPGGGNKILPEVYEGLCELNLARALLACGDPNGLARSIFKSYAADPRGVWALHARKVLSKADQKTRRNDNE